MGNTQEKTYRTVCADQGAGNLSGVLPDRSNICPAKGQRVSATSPEEARAELEVCARCGNKPEVEPTLDSFV